MAVNGKLPPVNTLLNHQDEWLDILKEALFLVQKANDRQSAAPE
ncbi:hypothetical protein [Magnetospira thiophila]